VHTHGTRRCTLYPSSASLSLSLSLTHSLSPHPLSPACARAVSAFLSHTHRTHMHTGTGQKNRTEMALPHHSILCGEKMRTRKMITYVHPRRAYHRSPGRSKPRASTAKPDKTHKPDIHACGSERRAAGWETQQPPQKIVCKGCGRHPLPCSNNVITTAKLGLGFGSFPVNPRRSSQRYKGSSHVCSQGDM
jgi:hypothetical protein